MTILEEIIELTNKEHLARTYQMWCIDEFLEEFVSKLDPPPTDVLEIGTCNGISTLVLAKYAKGNVYTFDATYRNSEFIWSFFPELRKKIIAFSGPQNVLDFTILDFSQWLDTWNINIDLAFIDGEHTYEGVKHDFKLSQLVKANRVLFHDVHGENPVNSGVGKFAILELGAEVIDSRKIYGYLETK